MKRGVFISIFIFLILIIAVCFCFFYKAFQKPSLNQTIRQALRGAAGKYSVAVEDLKTGQKESLYGDKVYKAGSLYKLWVMATAFEQIKNGTISENEILSEDIRVLNEDFNIDPESAEMTEGTITLTVEDALKQMITISHNYAALLLTKKIKLSNVAIFLKTNGFKNSHVGGSPTTTADDILAFFEKLYKGKLNNVKYTQEMLNLLKAQRLNDKLPKHLPKELIIAHKTGELDCLSHDGGIVFTKDRDYVIVVLSESSYPPGAEERISQVSKAVFDYFLLLH
jgi:beta-lactamase class A